jgi:hypothetical protein
MPAKGAQKVTIPLREHHGQVRVRVTADCRESVLCQDCGRQAVVQWRAWIDSTDGQVEHVKIICLGKHWFLLPARSLDASM